MENAPRELRARVGDERILAKDDERLRPSSLPAFASSAHCTRRAAARAMPADEEHVGARPQRLVQREYQAPAPSDDVASASGEQRRRTQCRARSFLLGASSIAPRLRMTRREHTEQHRRDRRQRRQRALRIPCRARCPRDDCRVPIGSSRTARDRRARRSCATADRAAARRRTPSPGTGTIVSSAQ